MSDQDTHIYSLGALPKLSAIFSIVGGGLIDPTTVACEIEKPDGTILPFVYITDPEIVRDSLGTFHMFVDADQSGMWKYRWFSTGTGQTANMRQFRIRPGLGPPVP